MSVRAYPDLSVLGLQVVTYLAGCGLRSCPMLLSKGYPDIVWNPCGGERYLDFLRFAVFVNGQFRLFFLGGGGVLRN